MAKTNNKKEILSDATLEELVAAVKNKDWQRLYEISKREFKSKNIKVTSIHSTRNAINISSNGSSYVVKVKGLDKNELAAVTLFSYAIGGLSETPKPKIYLCIPGLITTKHKKQHCNRDCADAMETLDMLIDNYRVGCVSGVKIDQDYETLKVSVSEKTVEETLVEKVNIEEKIPEVIPVKNETKIDDLTIPIVAYRNLPKEKQLEVKNEAIKLLNDYTPSRVIEYFKECKIIVSPATISRWYQGVKERKQKQDALSKENLKEIASEVVSIPIESQEYNMMYGGSTDISNKDDKEAYKNPDGQYVLEDMVVGVSESDEDNALIIKTKIKYLG